MAETIWIRDEAGGIQEMGLPLLEGIAWRMARGEITRVANAAGDPWEVPVAESEPDPRDLEIARLRALLAGTGVDPDSEPVDVPTLLAGAGIDPDSAGQRKPPAQSASKAGWVGWAVTQGMTPDDAEALTKADLVEKFGKD